MRFPSVFFLGAISASALSQIQSGSSAVGRSSTDAPEVTSNSNAFIARFEDKKGIHGIVGFSAKGMTPVRVNVELRGLPDGEGPFTYHIDENQVPADGDCNGAGGHLDPYGRGEEPPCNAEDPGSCQVGDLSGKHGSLQGSQDTQNYLDRYLSLTQGNPAYVGGHSVVVHSSNGNRIACANIELKQASSNGSGDNNGDASPSESANTNQPEETCSQTSCVRGIPKVTDRADQANSGGGQNGANKTKYVPKLQQLHCITNAHLHHPSSAQTEQAQHHTSKHRPHHHHHSSTKTKTKAKAEPHPATHRSKSHHSRTRHPATKTKHKHAHAHTDTATHSHYRTALSPPSMTSTGPAAHIPTDSTAQTSATPTVGPFSEGSSVRDLSVWRFGFCGVGFAGVVAVALVGGVSLGQIRYWLGL